jgi:GAF domain-containing protein
MNEPQVLPSFRRWMAAVSEIARAVNAAQPLDALLTRVAEQACTLLGFDYCAVMLADEARERVTVAGSCGLTPEYIALISDEGSLTIHPPGSELDTPAARAFREGHTIAVPECAGVRPAEAARPGAGLPQPGRLAAACTGGGDRAAGRVPRKSP